MEPLDAEEPNREQEIIGWMNLLQLSHLLDRVGGDVTRPVDWDWAHCLSPGEQQRISFARLFYHCPAVAVLDESTSGVSLDMERNMYEECRRLGIAVISCGHRQSLRQYHSRVVTVVADQHNHYSLQW